MTINLKRGFVRPIAEVYEFLNMAQSADIIVDNSF